MSGLSLYILFEIEVFTCLALYKKFKVFKDYSKQLDLLVIVAIMAVYVLPPNESWSNRVSFD